LGDWGLLKIEGQNKREKMIIKPKQHAGLKSRGSKEHRQ
jgi:hypothetical protein